MRTIPVEGLARMATCEHCGTDFPARSAEERYCCRGCEYVAQLISEQGFGQFYDLKQGLAVAPVRSRPFEEHDFSWLPAKVAEAEHRAAGKNQTASLELGLDGISCVGCVWLVERLFARRPGAIRATANPANGRLHLEWIAGACELEPFLRDLGQFGYVAVPTGALRNDMERRRLTARLGLCGAFALNTMGFSLPVYLGMPADSEFARLFQLIAFVSATLSMLVGGGYFIDRAWRVLKAGSLHIDLPIALGLLAAYAGSIAGWLLGSDRLLYFDFVSIFVFLMLGGRLVQTAAIDRNRRRLIRQQPVPDAVPRADPAGQTTAREEIGNGLRFLLGPGQALPVSAILTAGDADVSLEWIHGEADPVRFTTGSRLPAGAILLSRAPVVVEAVEGWRDSLMAKLTAPAENEKTTPGLDRLLRAYLTIVLGLGLAALLGWGCARGEWLLGTQAMISVFVVSCPCALGVSIPLADDLAASAVQRLGVFVRSAALWPRLRRVRQVIFDKTGTLTLERPVLINEAEVARLPDDAALALAQLTRGSLHPIARTLLEALGARGQKLLAAAPAGGGIREYPGLGVTWQSAGESWSLGKPGWSGGADEITAETPGSELRHNHRLVAAFHFRESLRPAAHATLRRLERYGLVVHVLSGDHPAKVARTAAALGIPAARARGGLSPHDKSAMVAALDHRDTLYLGDGANDSLAFDAAYVTGTPVVDRSLLESKADFYVLGAGLSFLPNLLDTARRRSRAVRTAFGFAVAYNLTTVGFSMAGWMSPLLAAVLMPLSSLVSLLLVATGSRRGPAKIADEKPLNKG